MFPQGGVETQIDAALVAQGAVFAEGICPKGGVVVDIVTLHKRDGLPVGKVYLQFVHGGQCSALVDGGLSGQVKTWMQVHIIQPYTGEFLSAWIVLLVELFTGIQWSVKKVMNSC